MKESILNILNELIRRYPSLAGQMEYIRCLSRLILMVVSFW